MDVFDYIEKEDGDLLIRDGDFVVSESTVQHQRDLMIANKGEYKQNPTVGIGLNNFLLQEMEEEELRLIMTREFEGDGMRVNKIEVNGFTNIKIDAEYESEANSVSR